MYYIKILKKVLTKYVNVIIINEISKMFFIKSTLVIA